MQTAGVVHLDHGTDRREVDFVAFREDNLFEFLNTSVGHCEV